MSFLQTLLSKEGIVTAFALVGLVMVLSHLVSRHLTAGRVHGSAIAILAGIGLAYWGGVITHGHNGLADVPMFAGLLPVVWSYRQRNLPLLASTPTTPLARN